MVTKAGVPAIRRGTPRATRFSVSSPSKSIPPPRRNSTGNLLTVSTEMSKLNPDRTVVASAASAACAAGQHIAERLAAMQYDQAITLRMLQRITDDAENIATR